MIADSRSNWKQEKFRAKTAKDRKAGVLTRHFPNHLAKVFVSSPHGTTLKKAMAATTSLRSFAVFARNLL
jgi:hypothetical protein